MKTVLYTEDMEPITVINLQPWAYDYLRKTGRVMLAVPPSWAGHPWVVGERPTLESCRVMTVRLECHWVQHYMSRNDHMLVTVDNEAAALLLPAVFLPGQTTARNEDCAKARGRGILEGFQMALDAMGRGE